MEKEEKTSLPPCPKPLLAVPTPQARSNKKVPLKSPILFGLFLCFPGAAWCACLSLSLSNLSREGHIKSRQPLKECKSSAPPFSFSLNFRYFPVYLWLYMYMQRLSPPISCSSAMHGFVYEISCWWGCDVVFIVIIPSSRFYKKDAILPFGFWEFVFGRGFDCLLGYDLRSWLSHLDVVDWWLMALFYYYSERF